MQGAVLVLSCSGGATSLFFCPLFFFFGLPGVSSEGWKGRDNTHELYISSSQSSLLPLEPYSTKRTAQHTLKEGEEITNMEAEGTEPWMFILVQSVLGPTFPHKYLCSAWEALFASVRDEIISTWRHIKVMLISWYSATEYEGQSFQTYKAVPWESTPVFALIFFVFFYYNMQKWKRCLPTAAEGKSDKNEEPSFIQSNPETEMRQ